MGATAHHIDHAASARAIQAGLAATASKGPTVSRTAIFPTMRHNGQVSEQTPPLAADANFVRPLTAEDRETAAAIQHAAWHSAYAPLAPASVVQTVTLEHLSAVWQAYSPSDPAGFALIAGRGTTAQAIAAVALDRQEKTAEVLALYVHPRATRRGHASRLLAETANTARRLGAQKLSVWAPAKDTPRLTFLEQTGLAPTGGKRELLGTVQEPPMVELHLSASLDNDS